MFFYGLLDTFSFSAAPEVPSIDQAYSKNSDSVTVEFPLVSGASGYILRAESKSGDFFLETNVSTSPGTIEQLQPYTDYLLSVMSVNSGGRSQPSYPTEARTAVMAPQMNTSSPSNTTILVTWPSVENAVLYTLCIIREDSSTRHKLNTTDTAVTFDDLEAGHHSSRIAWNRCYSLIMLILSWRPPVVAASVAGDGRSLSLSVHWATVHGASYYIASTSDGLNCSTDYSLCYINPVKCGQNHTVRVEAYNRAGRCPSSPVPVPCPPENIWVEEATAGNCSVKWDKVSQADHYVTFIKRDDGTEKSCNTTDTACWFFCMCGYTYFTSVFPYNEAGSSIFSPVRNYTTIPCCPQNVSVQLLSTETVEIMWSPVRGAELYETTAASRTTDTIHCNDTSPVCALSDLECDTVFNMTVTPCSELRGCNHTCKAHSVQTAPCAPEILNITQTNSSTYTVYLSSPNSHMAVYNVTATERLHSQRCQSRRSSCQFTRLSCGSTYQVTAVALTAVGSSLPGYSKTLETGPCCPTAINVTQVTQAMSNVTWSPSRGARSFIATLTSPRGHAKCHTLDTHCVMGCITCSTNYSVRLEAVSSTGHKSECTYQGFSSSPCCPTGIKLAPQANSTLRVWWRSLGPRVHRHVVDLYGTTKNYTCGAAPAGMSCDIHDVVCGVYTATVVPVEPRGAKVHFCQPRTFSGGSRGRR
uniref:Fibronectin type III domain containing 7a n=1 Tax=Salarias fasciatus TaxID=181472 RepID=A0A672F3L7_SALFA